MVVVRESTLPEATPAVTGAAPEFKRVFGHFPTAVAVITAMTRGQESAGLAGEQDAGPLFFFRGDMDDPHRYVPGQGERSPTGHHSGKGRIG
jgi:hypothetical protein